MKSNLKLISHFFEKISVELPSFPNKSGETQLLQPKSTFTVFRNETRSSIFALKVDTTVKGNLRSKRKVVRFSVSVRSVGVFDIRGGESKPSKLTPSLRKEGVKTIQEISFNKLAEVLKSPYLNKIPFPLAKKITRVT